MTRSKDASSVVAGESEKIKIATYSHVVSLPADGQ
jgi:hypothetical protein